jgi:hypothetical protein
MPPERIDRKLAAVLAFLASTGFVATGQSLAAPHQLECSATLRVDPHEQRIDTRLVRFIYEDRERTLSYVDDAGRVKKCLNSAVGSVEIMGACGSETVWISKSTYQFELNGFDYRWNARRHVNEETWAYGEKGWCEEVEAEPQ